jgi:hypothetical protein
MEFEMYHEIYHSLQKEDFVLESDLTLMTIASCDVCSQAIPKNHRYKCSICEDYDLCENCFLSKKSSGKHKINHEMIKK